MTKNILILTDFSENAWNAIAYAQNLFISKRCNFHLLHVSDYIDYAYNASLKNNVQLVAQESVVPSKKQLNELIAKIEHTFTNQNHAFFGVHEHGYFLDTIKKNIAEKKIELIIMGTKGVSGLRKHIIGSNAGDVITKIKCNTLIIPKGATHSTPQEIAFPTDYTIFYSHKILEVVSDILKISNGKIRVMNVTKSNRKLTESQEKNKEYLSDYLNELFPKRNSFHSITNKSVNAAIQCFVESRDVEMILMVAKNLNFMQQMLFDSLVEKISFHTKVPFFVLHE